MPEASPTAVFSVCLPVRLFAQLVADHKGASNVTSVFLRQILEKLAGDPSDWNFPDSNSAVEFLETRGFPTSQFQRPRFLRGRAKEELARERALEKSLEKPTSSRAIELTRKVLEGVASEEEVKELSLVQYDP